MAERLEPKAAQPESVARKGAGMAPCCARSSPVVEKKTGNFSVNLPWPGKT
jgi:hypothetical protein